MGTKRQVAHRVVPLVADFNRGGAVLDLFSGMGSVAAALANRTPVITNDALGFTAAFARARLLPSQRKPVSEVISRLQPSYRRQVAWLSSEFRAQLATEHRAVDGGLSGLKKYMTHAEHAANSREVREKAVLAQAAGGRRHHQLVTLYYAAGYFSLRQAIQIDAIRHSIEFARMDVDRDWLLAAMIAAAASVVNSPGHTAQYLKPSTAAVAARIARSWRRDIWRLFADRLSDVSAVGTCQWRESNSVRVGDALTLAAGEKPAGLGLVYADPPYTRDQYSRFYHVYETLFHYDFPEILGAGRTPIDGFRTPFSHKAEVQNTFRRLLADLRRWQVPVVLSYPKDGLLAMAGVKIEDILRQEDFLVAKRVSFRIDHSTMGGSKGPHTKEATENLYVCI